MAEAPVHPHQNAWFWIGTAMSAAAVGIGAAYYEKATHFSWLGPPMWLAYACGAVAVLCFMAGIRGRRFPLARSAPPAPKLLPPKDNPPSARAVVPALTRAMLGGVGSMLQELALQDKIDRAHNDALLEAATTVPGDSLAAISLRVSAEFRHVLSRLTHAKESGTAWPYLYKNEFDKHQVALSADAGLYRAVSPAAVQISVLNDMIQPGASISVRQMEDVDVGISALETAIAALEVVNS